MGLERRTLVLDGITKKRAAGFACLACRK